jgi:hypothetical protein
LIGPACFFLAYQVVSLFLGYLHECHFVSISISCYVVGCQLLS